MRLKDVCNVFLDGDWIENKDQSPAGIRLIQTGNIGNGIFLEKKERARFISEETFARLKCNEIFPGDILVSRLPDPIGRACIIPDTDERMITAVDCTICRVDKSMILPEFLCYFMRSAMYCNAIMENVTGTTRKRISRKNLGNVNVRLFPLDDQQAIVHKLDYITKIIKLRKKELAQLDYLIKARFIELFGDPITNTKGWKIEKAEKHIDLLSGFPFDSSQYTQYGVKICGGLIIMPQRIDWDSCKYWSSTEGLEEYTLQEKDIVMALDRPWISEGFKIAMVDADELPALLIQRTARIRAVDINQYYLMHCFALGGFDSHCNVTGSLVPHISAKDIRSFPIMLPPIELQQQFAAFVEQTDKSKVVA